MNRRFAILSRVKQNKFMVDEFLRGTVITHVRERACVHDKLNSRARERYNFSSHR